MSAADNGGCGVGQGLGSSSGNPRKFSEKIARLTQRQAEDTAAFQEVIISTRIQVQRARQSRCQVPYYGGSLPDVNQIGRSSSDLQGQLSSSPDNGYPTRLQSTPEQTQGEGQLSYPVRTNRRHADNSPYRSVHLSPPAEQSWRRYRNWSSISPVDKNHLMPLSITQLNRTNSDSALHTSVRHTHSRDQFGPNQHDLSSRNRLNFFPYPVSPIEENVLEEEKPLRNTKRYPSVSSRTRSLKIPCTNIPSSSHQKFGTLLNVPSVLNTSGSLPDLSSLHLPSPQQAGVEPNKPNHSGVLITACSTGHLPGTHLGASEDLSVSLQSSFSNPLLQSSHSNPDIQSSRSSHSLSSSLSSTSFNLSLSNSSLQSSPSNQSLQSFLSNSSLSGQSLQSATSHCSYSSGIGGSGSASSLSCSPRPISQAQVPSRKRTPLSPLVLPTGGESHGPQSKQFSQFGSPPLSSITQGVLMNNNQVPKESRPPTYPQRLPQPQCPLVLKQDAHASPSQQLYCLTEGLHQPRPEPRRAPGCGVYQPQQDLFGQQSVPETQSVHPLQHQQQHRQPNLLYQFQQVQTDGQKLDTEQQNQSLSQRCDNPLQQNRSLLKQQHQIPQQHQQKQGYQHLQEKQRQQYEGDPHQVYTHQWQQQMYTRQAEPQPYLQQQARPREIQHQPESFQVYQQQQREERRRYPQESNLPDQSLDLNGQNRSIPQKVPRVMTGKHQSHDQGRSWAHQKIQGHKDQIELTEISSQISSFTDNNTDFYINSTLNHLQHQSYNGLHLTLSQTQALSEQLRQLIKEPLWGDSDPQCLVENDGLNCGTLPPKSSLYSQKQSSLDCHSGIVTDQTPEDFSNVLPLLDFDPISFSLDSPLQIDPLDLQELNMLADGDIIDDTVKEHCSNLLR